MKKSKILLLVLFAVLLVTASVLGTLAYLMSQSTVVNTFTVGNVNINLDEAAVDANGSVIVGVPRVKSNRYQLIPGKTYTKDPTVTVVGGSEEAYVRMLVTANCLSQLDAAFAPNGADLTTIFNGYDQNTWIFEGETRDVENNTVTYEFRYKHVVAKTNENIVLEPLFDSITIPNSFDAEDILSIADLEITIVGHAIQSFGFADADEAWGAFAY